jgi:2-oxoglutarate ferredoxin oxidoreductase subunit beta
MVTGDGDSLAIGGNHFIHVLRRNIDINIMLFNNKIYGLTKGQYSPTTPMGKVTKTSPHGTFEHPFSVGELAIGAQGTFFARAVDTNPKMMQQVMTEAGKHKGTSLIEILQNCVIFFNKVHADVTSRDTKEDKQLYLQHGKPMIFGKESDKGIVLRGTKLEVVKIGENGITESDLLVHDANQWETGIHVLLANMSPPDFPVALGVIRSVSDFTYELEMERIMNEERNSSPIKNMDDLLNSGKTWNI